MTEPSDELIRETMTRFVAARDAACSRLNEPGYDERLAELGVDATALRVFARHVEHELEGVEVGAGAVFVAGFATALELLAGTAEHSARV